jgi:hypothetical protein
MGSYVHIHVCFACDNNDAVAELAKKHLLMDEFKVYENREASWFLKSLSERSGNNPGPKGGLSLWGIIGNYTSGKRFCDVLIPFWTELLSGVKGGPHDFERICVFEEQEDAEAVTVYEISRERDGDPTIQIKKHERLPFAFGQV